MNILEYEELLNLKKEEELPKEKIWPREFQQEPTDPFIRTGMSVGTNESFVSSGRSASVIWRAEDLTYVDQLDIMNAAINFINNRARGMRYNHESLYLLSREIQSFIETYVYRWFPFIRHPAITSTPEMLEQHAEITIKINNIYTGTLGVNVHL